MLIGHYFMKLVLHFAAAVHLMSRISVSYNVDLKLQTGLKVQENIISNSASLRKV